MVRTWTIALLPLAMVLAPKSCNISFGGGTPSNPGIDLTRSLSTAVAFAKGCGDRDTAYLYVFAMPDLRGSITSDIDQHLTLARLEAICPPAAKRPHHQDAYLVSRFPEPAGSAGPGSRAWDDWQGKTDLMRRLVTKFLLSFREGRLPGSPRIDLDFLIPSLVDDEFRKRLEQSLLPIVEDLISNLPPPTLDVT